MNQTNQRGNKNMWRNVISHGVAGVLLILGWICAAAECADPGTEKMSAVARQRGYEITGMTKTGGCVRVDYILRPTTQSFIRCQLALPARGTWSGRLWGLGNGGPGGLVNVPMWMARHGDIAVHTDLGTSRGVMKSTVDGRENREALIDFGWRATHLMTVSAKELSSAYFGRAPAKCYFRGASTGGGQGFHEALRFPEDYDGIISYVPANTRIPLHIYFAWNLRLTKTAGGRDVFTKQEFAAVEQAALDWFADKDAPFARGKFLTDTRHTESAERGILARAQALCPSLADPDKTERLRKMFAGPVLDGRRVHAGIPFSASIEAARGNQWMLRWFLGPDRPLHTVTDAELSAWLRAWSPVCDACGTGFGPFAARGGKMIVVGGLEDSIVPYPSMIDWYERTRAELGDALAETCRLYLLPGRAHASDRSRGCTIIDNDAQLIIDWVERGIRPDTVESTLRGGGKLSVKPYPDNWPR